MIRVGIGQDSHKYIENKKMIIGGLEIPSEKGQDGNSDGDTVIHALCNALASSVGKGSISTYADEMCLTNGITDSEEFLKVANSYVEESGYKINNISITIEAKQPKLEKHIPQIKESIAKVLNIDSNLIGITATSGEGLTSFGNGDGIQAFVIVSIIRKG